MAIEEPEQTVWQGKFITAKVKGKWEFVSRSRGIKAAVILAMVYAIAGLALGIISRTEKDIFRFFPDLGILINAIVLGCIVGILYLGLI